MKKNDYLLAVFLLAVSLICGIFFLNNEKNNGFNVCVYHDNELIAKYSLLTDGLYEVRVPEGINLLKVEGGKAFIVSSDCLTEECIHMQAIEYSGERIVCLPHHLIFEISGNESHESDIDGVTY